MIIFTIYLVHEWIDQDECWSKGPAHCSLHYFELRQNELWGYNPFPV